MRAGSQSPGLFQTSRGVVVGIAILLAAPAAFADICGYPLKGKISLSRDGRTVAIFQVGLAEKGSQYRQGLMFCPELAPGSGLLFIYPAPARRVFWMKDTPLRLAIIFADADGRIRAIERGQPYSTGRIYSPEGIQYVLEINYREAEPLRSGDHIHLRLLPP
jgi:uncharacterized membrane protein (UPF0127 family)